LFRWAHDAPQLRSALLRESSGFVITFTGPGMGAALGVPLEKRRAIT
jgi:hypothetical protein